jgi:hypothetical protein
MKKTLKRLEVCFHYVYIYNHTISIKALDKAKEAARKWKSADLLRQNHALVETTSAELAPTVMINLALQVLWSELSCKNNTAYPSLEIIQQHPFRSSSNLPVIIKVCTNYL